MSPEITASRFPCAQRGALIRRIPLVRCERKIYAGEILVELEQLHLCAATLPELLAVVTDFLSFYKGTPIAALGSVWKAPTGYSYVPCFGDFGGGRFLGLHCLEYGFAHNRVWYFAATYPTDEPRWREMVLIPEVPESLFQVTVNYNAMPQSVVAACGFAHVSKKINLQEIPIAETGEVALTMGLARLKKGPNKSWMIPTEDIIGRFDEQGFRPATLIELLAFGAAYQNLPQFPQAIFALATTIPNPEGKPLVPHIDALGDARNLGLHFRYDMPWQCVKHFQFLVVKNS